MSQSPQERFAEYLTRQTQTNLVTAQQAGVLVLLWVMLCRGFPGNPLVLGIILTLVTGGWFAATAEFRKARQKTRAALERIRTIIKNSVPVTAHIVQANSNIFSPGTGNFPCLVLVTFDRNATRDPDFLPDLAEQLYALKETEQTEPDLREAANFTTDERAEHYRRRRVPLSLTGGVVVYVCDLLLFRSRLQEGFLTQRRLPCLAEPGETGGLELLPYWIAEGKPEPAHSLRNKAPEAYKVTPRRQ